MSEREDRMIFLEEEMDMVNDEIYFITDQITCIEESLIALRNKKRRYYIKLYALADELAELKYKNYIEKK
jgi:hypothetical protein